VPAALLDDYIVVIEQDIGRVQLLDVEEAHICLSLDEIPDWLTKVDVCFGRSMLPKEVMGDIHVTFETVSTRPPNRQIEEVKLDRQIAEEPPRHTIALRFHRGSGIMGETSSEPRPDNSTDLFGYTHHHQERADQSVNDVIFSNLKGRDPLAEQIPRSIGPPWWSYIRDGRYYIHVADVDQAPQITYRVFGVSARNHPYYDYPAWKKWNSIHDQNWQWDAGLHAYVPTSAQNTPREAYHSEHRPESKPAERPEPSSTEYPKPKPAQGTKFNLFNPATWPKPEPAQYTGGQSFHSEHQPKPAPEPELSERTRRPYRHSFHSEHQPKPAPEPEPELPERTRRPYRHSFHSEQQPEPDSKKRTQSPDSQHEPSERAQRPYSQSFHSEKRPRPQPQPAERPRRPHSQTFSTGSTPSRPCTVPYGPNAVVQCYTCTNPLDKGSYTLHGLRICQPCYAASSLPLVDQFKHWSDFVTKQMQRRQISKFPGIPPSFCTCAMEGCKAVKSESSLRVCSHDLKRLLEAGGISGTALKKEALRWHPDRFANCCTEEFRENGIKASTEMFQLFGLVSTTLP
jgi:hypothetical protein